MECVTKERIVDLSALPVGRGNNDFLQAYDLWRWYDIYSPIPVRLPQLCGSCPPSRSVDRVSLRNGCRAALYDLLYDNLSDAASNDSMKTLTSITTIYGRCQVGKRTEPWVQYPPQDPTGVSPPELFQGV